MGFLVVVGMCEKVLVLFLLWLLGRAFDCGLGWLMVVNELRVLGGSLFGVLSDG